MKNKSILIADDDADIVELLTRRCRALGLEVDSANNAMTALGKAEEDAPDLVILDVDMPYGNGLSVCEMMASHEELRSIPVIMLTSSSREETIRRCHQLCAYYVLKCPDVWPRIEPVLRELLALEETDAGNRSKEAEAEPDSKADVRPADLMDAVFAVLGVEEGDSLRDEQPNDSQQRSDRPWVLSIEDDDDFALALRLRLEEFGVQVLRAKAGMEGYRRAFLDAPQAVILDYQLPQGNGDYVLRRLKETPATSEIPVIVLTGLRDASIERQVRALGASDFLTKPVDWKRLRAAIENRLEQIPQLGKKKKPQEFRAETVVTT
jgi:DNA-binding response OmpR family regulator